MPFNKNNYFNQQEKIKNQQEKLEKFKQNLILQKGNEIFEIRIFNYGAYSGLFTADEKGFQKLITELKKYHLLDKKITIYQSLQKLKSNVVPKANLNRLFKKGDEGFHATSDSDVESYNWIFIDVDPVHKADTQIPNSELVYTEQARDKIIAELKKFGFNTPTVVFSGNGQHIYLRIDEPNNEKTRTTIKQFLTVLSTKFSTDKLKIDTVVGNPSRITKFSGSWSAKGEDTPETPYRQCKLLQEGSEEINDIQLVHEYIDKHADYLKTTQSSKNKPKKRNLKQQKVIESDKAVTSAHANFDDDRNKFLPIDDVPSYLEGHGLDYSIEQNDNYTLYKLSVCPFNEEHNRGECSLIEVEGKGVCFNCFHNHCQKYTIFDFIKLYPCGKIPPIDGTGKTEAVFNTLVVNGILLRSSKGNFYFCFRGRTYPLNSEDLKGEIRKLYLIINKCVPDINADTKIIKMLESFSSDSQYYTNAAIGQRMILHQSILYYALSKNKFVIVNSDGCFISDMVPDDVFFVNTNLEPQKTPDFTSQPNDLPELLLKVCNVSDDKISLLVANLLSFFREDINSPVLVLKGSRGSCKSSCARILKTIINPEKVDLLSFPDKEDGLIASLSNNDLCVFDNVERITEAMSSKLCLAVTNGFTTRRKLYTDNTEMSICIRSNIILTCITDVVSQSDLAERSNVIHLERMEAYRTEAEVNQQVSKLMPQILGAVFNALSIVFTTANEIKLDRPPRMADFAFFAMAAVKAVGLDEDEFLDLYTKNITEAVSVCAVDDPLIVCIDKVLDTYNNSIEMGAEQLLAQINQTAIKLNITLSRYNPSTLSRALKTNTADLKSVGITFKREKRGSSRVIILKREAANFKCSPIEEDDEVTLDFDD